MGSIKEITLSEISSSIELYFYPWKRLIHWLMEFFNLVSNRSQKVVAMSTTQEKLEYKQIKEQLSKLEIEIFKIKLTQTLLIEKNVNEPESFKNYIRDYITERAISIKKIKKLLQSIDKDATNSLKWFRVKNREGDSLAELLDIISKFESEVDEKKIIKEKVQS